MVGRRANGKWFSIDHCLESRHTGSASDVPGTDADWTVHLVGGAPRVVAGNAFLVV